MKLFEKKEIKKIDSSTVFGGAGSGETEHWARTETNCPWNNGGVAHDTSDHRGDWTTDC